MSKKDEIRDHIRSLVKDYYQEAFTETVEPGKKKIGYAGRVFDECEIQNAVDASLDFWLTEGRFTKKFEKMLGDFIGVKHCLSVNSGSSANLIALSSLTSSYLGEKRLKPGDEVITLAAGFPTTVNPIIQQHAIPVFIDLEIGSYVPTLDQIKEAVTPKTRAIMIAHTMGTPFDAKALREFCDQREIWLIEDCCDALGSKIDGQHVGTFGHFGTLSFYPAHHITMGEGGAVYTTDKELARIARSFRDWGRDCYCPGGKNNTCGKRFSQKLGTLPEGYDHKYIYSHIGYNLKITDIQASIGCAQLEKVASFIQKRKDNWAFLKDRLQRFSKFLILPEIPEYSIVSPFGFVLTVKDNAPFTRNEITAYLEQNKIETRNLFCGNLLRHPAYTEIDHRVHSNLKVTEQIMENTFFIGIYPGLDQEMLNYIDNTFSNYFKSLL